MHTQATTGQSANSDTVLRPPLPQVVEVSGSESPSLINWRTRNQRARNDLSRARLRALENSIENGQTWVPSSPAHRKTWEEEVDPSHSIFLYVILNIFVSEIHSLLIS